MASDAGATKGIQLTPELASKMKAQRLQDRLFHLLTLSFASLVLIVLAGIIISLLIFSFFFTSGLFNFLVLQLANSSSSIGEVTGKQWIACVVCVSAREEEEEAERKKI